MKHAKILLTATMISVMLSMGSSKALALFENYGSIVPNSDVAQAFEKYQADPNLIYYFSGSDSGPRSIIGVNKAYTLDNTFWKKCVTQEIFKKHVSSMQFWATSRTNSSLSGFVILDNMGVPIGTWYSRLRTPTFVRIKTDKSVYIPTPYWNHRSGSFYSPHED